nr:hypothetical protein [Tanacetum cinerariifolium]
HRHKQRFAVLVGGIIEGLNTVLAHQGGLDAARDGPSALKAGFVVKQRGSLGPAQAHGGFAHQPHAEDIGLVALAAAGQELVAFAQEG